MINGVEKKKTQHNFVFIVLNFSLTFVFFFCEISDNYISLRSQTGMLPLFLNRECFSCFIPSSDFQLSSLRKQLERFPSQRAQLFVFSPHSWINNEIFFCALPCLSLSSFQSGQLNKYAYLVYVNQPYRCLFNTQRQPKSKPHLLHSLLPLWLYTALEGPLSKCQPQQCESTVQHHTGFS